MKKHNWQQLREYIDDLQTRGRYTFSKKSIIDAYPTLTDTAIRSTLARLAKKQRIIHITRGFYTIIPLEYKTAGAPPASWYIDSLMQYLQSLYYVGLLSAAAIHGAAHQQPQEFQIITNKTRRPILVGRTYIRFLTKKNLDSALSQRVKTPTGEMSIATPETTAFDLITYPTVSGYWNNIITVLQELAESLSAEKLVSAAKIVSLSTVQRLGYLLDQLGFLDITEPLHHWLKNQKPLYVALNPSPLTTKTNKDKKWHILINTEIESDL